MANEILKLPMGPRGKQISNVVKYGALAIVGWVVAPFIAQAIGGLVGLAIVFGLVGLISAFLPWMSMKVGNLAIKFFIQEIRENPVESRMQVSGKSWAKLDDTSRILGEFNGKVKAFTLRVAQMKRDFPADAKAFEDQLSAMEQLLLRRYAGWHEHKKNLQEFDKQTVRVRNIWEMTLASDEMAKAAGKLGQDKALLTIINDESIRAADDAMARSFGYLDHINMTEGAIDLESLPQAVELQRLPDGSFEMPLTLSNKSTQLQRVA